MKVRVTFVSKDIEGNEIGEIHDEELSDNFMSLISEFLGDSSLIYGKQVGAWEVKEERLRLCVEEENKDILCYTCKVEAELSIHLTVVDQQTLDGDDWSTKLLKGILSQRRGDT